MLCPPTGVVFDLRHCWSNYIKNFNIVLVFLLGASHKRSCVEKNLASSFEVFSRKSLNGIPPSLCGRLVLRPSSQLIASAQPVMGFDWLQELVL